MKKNNKGNKMNMYKVNKPKNNTNKLTKNSINNSSKNLNEYNKRNVDEIVDLEKTISIDLDKFNFVDELNDDVVTNDNVLSNEDSIYNDDNEEIEILDDDISDATSFSNEMKDLLIENENISEEKIEEVNDDRDVHFDNNSYDNLDLNEDNLTINNVNNNSSAGDLENSIDLLEDEFVPQENSDVADDKVIINPNNDFEVVSSTSEDDILDHVSNLYSDNREETIIKDENKTTEVNNNISDNSDGNKFHFSFEARLMVLCSCILVSIIFGISLLILALNYGDKVSIRYSENSIVNYKVCLSDNDYYANCQSENMEYVSTITNNIPIEFIYNKVFSVPVKFDMSYYVIGKLSVYDRDNVSKILLEENKMLVKRTNVSGKREVAKFNVNVDVPFKEHNNYVNGYKSKYSLSSLAEYNVCLYVDDGTGAREVAKVKIPLSSQTFSITKDLLNKNNEKLVLSGDKVKDIDYKFLIPGIIFLIVSFALAFRVFVLVYKLLNANITPYERKLKQILSEYDRVIVIAHSEYKFDTSKQFVKVDNFFELLDARDALEKPIIYEKVNNIKSYFYVEDADRVYRYTLKESDFEKEK